MDYVLVDGDVVLARITNCAPDQPWYEGDFDPTRAFEAVRPLFDKAQALLNREAWPEWEALWQSVRDRGIRLRAADSADDISDFALYVDGGRCRFRYSE